MKYTILVDARGFSLFARAYSKEKRNTTATLKREQSPTYPIVLNCYLVVGWSGWTYTLEDLLPQEYVWPGELLYKNTLFKIEITRKLKKLYISDRTIILQLVFLRCGVE